MSVIDPAKPKLTKTDLRKIQLAHGGHPDRGNGLCVMEVAAWMAGQPHTDHPPCVSPVIGQFLRSWNDALPDGDRDMLKPYAHRVLNTATGRGDDVARAWLATDWLVRECAPAWLRLAGLTSAAESLEGLVPFTSAQVAREQQPTIKAAQKEAAAARDAARAAARAAAGAAAWAAAGAAARAAAWAAAWDAARDAARAAAWAAAWDAARDAAGAAAWAAAWDAAGAALAPTTKGLQKSALGLLDRMIAVGKA